MRNIKRSDELLQNIAAGVNKLDHNKVGDLEVVFYEDGKEVLATGLATALDYLAQDIYWNEEGSWANAERAEVRTL